MNQQYSLSSNQFITQLDVKFLLYDWIKLIPYLMTVSEWIIVGAQFPKLTVGVLYTILVWFSFSCWILLQHWTLFELIWFIIWLLINLEVHPHIIVGSFLIFTLLFPCYTPFSSLNSIMTLNLTHNPDWISNTSNSSPLDSSVNIWQNNHLSQWINIIVSNSIVWTIAMDNCYGIHTGGFISMKNNTWYYSLLHSIQLCPVEINSTVS